MTRRWWVVVGVATAGAVAYASRKPSDIAAETPSVRRVDRAPDEASPPEPAPWREPGTAPADDEPAAPVPVVERVVTRRREGRARAEGDDAGASPPAHDDADGHEAPTDSGPILVRQMDAPALSGTEVASPVPTATVATAAAPVAGERLVVPRSKRVSGPTMTAAAATLGLLAIVLSTVAFVIDVETDTAAPSAPARAGRSEAESVAALVARPTTRRIAVSGSAGRIVLAVGPGGEGALVIDGLGAAPANRDYQAWVIPRRGTAPRSAAVFDGTQMLVPLTRRVPPGATVAITLERSGGAAKPSRPPRLVARVDA